MQQPQVENLGFGKIRNFFWPIYMSELKKVLPMFMLFFLVSFIYNLFRCMKVSLITKAPGSSAQVVPFLKVGAVLPGAIILTAIFIKLISKFNRDQVFYIFVCGFLTYFSLFMLVLYPNHDSLQLIYVSNLLKGFLPEGFAGFIAAIRHLNLTIFYVLSELWGGVVLSMLAWGFANEVTKMDEAKRFYATFTLGANCSGFFSNVFVQLSKKIPALDFIPYDASKQWLFYQLFFALTIGVGILFLYRYLSKTIYPSEIIRSSTIKMKEKTKLSLLECCKYSLKSRYIACIVVIVVAYNIIYNLTDFLWTDQAEKLFAAERDLNAYMNKVSGTTAAFAVILALLVSGNVIRFWGWRAAALITPITWGLSSLGFFSGLLAGHSFIADVLGAYVTNPANFVLLLGSIQICLGRACKYTVFDETKEIAFIPLPKDSQRKGKAVVDGISSRFGKSGGAIIIIVMLIIFEGSVEKIVPYLFILLVLTLCAWIYAVTRLGGFIDNKDIPYSEIDNSK